MSELPTTAKNHVASQIQKLCGQISCLSHLWARDVTDVLEAIAAALTNDTEIPRPFDSTPMLLWCPSCGERHIDVGEFATKPHHTHACQACGMVWRPAVQCTVGVQFLPGFRDQL